MSCASSELSKIKRKAIHCWLLLESTVTVPLDCFLQLEDIIRAAKWVSLQRCILISFLWYVSLSTVFYSIFCNICICFVTRRVVMRDSAPTNLHFQIKFLFQNWEVIGIPQSKEHYTTSLEFVTWKEAL